MSITKTHHRLLFGLGVLLAAGALLVWGYGAAVQRLRGGIEQALGPNASVGSLAVTWNGVEVRDVRVRAERTRGWPAEDELRAARVRLVPSFASLWRRGWHVRSITIEGGYVSALRTRDGRLRLLPSLLEAPRGATAPTQANAATPRIEIGEVRLAGARFELHDASVRQPPHRLRIDALDARVGPLVLPALDVPIEVDLSGNLQGVRHTGRLQVQGELTPATRDARLDARLSGADLLMLQPYLLRVAEGGVRGGQLDLVLQAGVAANRLHAPGTLTLRGLELSGDGSFAGVPRQAVLAALARDGRIEVRFVLEGRLDDPKFSLNENIATRLASSLAGTLGVSLGGVVEGVGNVIKGLFGR
jgi:hypothetical protein